MEKCASVIIIMATFFKGSLQVGCGCLIDQTSCPLLLQLSVARDQGTNGFSYIRLSRSSFGQNFSWNVSHLHI